jgi:Predicted pyridoxal phosphate-dependent enzyme apparently involved in regulation of cell wall biogenesis
MSEPTMLPFARPAIDADTIAAVGEVLASGWITSGPKVLEFESRLSELFAAGRCARSRTALPRWRSRSVSPASAPATR